MYITIRQYRIGVFKHCYLGYGGYVGVSNLSLDCIIFVHFNHYIEFLNHITQSFFLALSLSKV